MIKSVFIIAIVALSNILQAQDDMKNLIPGKDDIRNWTIKKPAETYSTGNLYSFIPNETDLFVEYGFEEAATCTFRNYMANTVRIDIFKMTSDDAAFGIYSFKSLPVNKPSDLGDRSALYDYYVDVWKGKYYYRVTANNKHYGMIDTLLLMAEYVDGKITGKGEKPLLATVMEDSLRYINVKYLKGIVALDQIYAFGHGSVVGFNEAVVGKKERLQVFIIGYKDGRKAREWIASARGKFKHYDDLYSNFQLHDTGWSIDDKTGTPVSFMPYGKYLLIIKGEEWEDAVKGFENITNVLVE